MVKLNDVFMFFFVVPVSFSVGFGIVSTSSRYNITLDPRFAWISWSPAMRGCTEALRRWCLGMMFGDDVSMQKMSCFPGFPLNKRWPKNIQKAEVRFQESCLDLEAIHLTNRRKGEKGWTDFINFSGQAWKKTPRQSPKASDFCCVFKVFPGWWNIEIWEIHPNFMKFPGNWEILSIGKSHPQTLETEEELTGLFVHTPESQVPITLKRLAGNTSSIHRRNSKKNARNTSSKCIVFSLSFFIALDLLKKLSIANDFLFLWNKSILRCLQRNWGGFREVFHCRPAGLGR